MTRFRGVVPFAALAIAALAAAQFTATRGNLTLSAVSGGYSSDPAKGIERFPLTGTPGQPVKLTDRQSGSTFTAAQAMTILISRSTGKSKVDSINAEGAVNFVRTDNRGTTTLTGSGAMYRADGNEGDLTVAGPVNVRGSDTVSKRDYVATGSRLTARTVAIESAKGTESLYSGILAGPVRFEGTSVAGEKIVATGNRMEIENRKKPSTITLIDDIKIVSTGGENDGDVSGLQRLVITLNDKNEVATIEGSGSPARTVIRPKSGGGR